MRNGSLGKFLTSNRIAFEETIVAWLIECLSGLEHLIRLNILHSDIKPDNLLLDHDNRLKIGDMGLLEFIPPEHSTITKVQGSPEYLPYETLMKDKKTEKMGVWSVGVSFFEVVTGDLPWTDSGTAGNTQQRTATTLAGHAELQANGFPELRAPFFIPSYELKDVLENKMIVFDEVQRATVGQILNLPYIAHFKNTRLGTLAHKVYLPDELASHTLAPANPVELYQEHEYLKISAADYKGRFDRLGDSISQIIKENEKVKLTFLNYSINLFLFVLNFYYVFFFYLVVGPRGSAQ